MYSDFSADLIRGVPALYNTSFDSHYYDLGVKKYPGGRLTSLDTQMFPIFANICKVSPKTWSVWYSSDEDYGIELAKYRQNSDVFEAKNKSILMTYKEYRSDSLVSVSPYTVNPDQYYFLIRFNSYYSLMSCPYECSLDTPLNLIKVKYTSVQDTLSSTSMHSVRKGNEMETNQTVCYLFAKVVENNVFCKKDLTLRRMIGCEEKVTPFDPNYFCHPNRNFLSVFTLGKDVYFQETGRFWRYSYHGFNQEIGPNKYIKPIRLDSDLTAFLENQGFGE